MLSKLLKRIPPITVSFFTVSLLTGCSITSHSSQPAFADIHLHFNYTHAEVTRVEDAVNKLKQHNVVLATVSSEPTEFALQMRDYAGDWIIPFASPYYKAGNRLNWYYDNKLLDAIRQQLESGRYGGIGEVHITAGVGPRRDNPVFTGLLRLAQEFKLPFLIHTDTDDYRFLLSICQNYAEVRFIWAHAGGLLQPDQLAPLMQLCPNVWLDLAARDPDHYGGLTDNNGKLLAGWYELIIQYQERIMTGTDPVWNAEQIYRWYEADEGWEHYDDFIRFHRAWMKQLPAAVENKVRLTNAQRFFSVKQ